MIEDSVVVIPTRFRPEFLALCLERIFQAPKAEHMDIRIFLDTCEDQRADEVEYCRNAYAPTAQIYRAGKHVEVLSGCWNILQSLKAGYETGKEFIFFIEEDVLIRPSKFFQWHWDTHASDKFFVTCGRRLGHLPLSFYSNPGTCYRRDSLALVIPHINDSYFDNPRLYLDRFFPLMKGMDGPLDDGLIRKVQRSVDGKVTCAVPPVAAHCGLHFYNVIDKAKNDQSKPIQDRIQRLREILPTLDVNGRYERDWECPFWND